MYYENTHELYIEHFIFLVFIEVFYAQELNIPNEMLPFFSKKKDILIYFTLDFEFFHDMYSTLAQLFDNIFFLINFIFT